MNSRQRGAVAVAKAIKWFTENGYNVAIPISEIQRYDLVVEKNGLYRVEVKSSINRKIGLRTNSPNYNVRIKEKVLTTGDAEMLFAVTIEGMFLIPVSSISGMKQIIPSKYAAPLVFNG